MSLSRVRWTRDEDRDGDVFNASAGYIRLFKEGRGAFNIIYEYSNDDTDGKNWANTGNRFIVSCLIPDLIKRTNLVLSGDIFLQEYKYKNTHPEFDKKRKDETYTVSATVIAEIVKALYLNLQYSYIRADSNISVYDYDRNIYTMGFEYRF